MRKAINGVLWLVGLTVVLAVYFFVPLGRYTLFEHTLRIAATEPAQELGDELGTATRELGERAIGEWETRRELRREAAGEPPGEGAGGALRLRLERDGVHVGDRVLSAAELRERLREAHRVASDVSAVLEAAPGVSAADVQALRELLREERVPIREEALAP
ncbi:MAG: hypothetical protein KF729_28825 [Sandaracinaceae bacterium]|nr:hypothetical protein [Sandaracinaceae bacterium]